MKKLLSAVTTLLLSGLLLTGCQKENLVDENAPIAEAGPSQNIQLPVSVATLTGSGTSDNGPITGYLWSLISGPNVPVIVSPSSPATNVNSLVAGTYIFQFAVIDSKGRTGIDTTHLNVTGTSPQTITIQPTNNSTEWHFFGNATQNQSGHAPQLSAGAWTNGGENIFIRGAIKFDISAIPASATILSAKLTLYSAPDPLNGNLTTANSGTDNSFYIRRISSNWTPAGSTWQNQPPSTTTGQVLVPHTASAFYDVIDTDVTGLFQTMHTTNNYGFMIQLQNEVPFNIRQFASSIHANATKHPKLVITYQ